MTKRTRLGMTLTAAAVVVVATVWAANYAFRPTLAAAPGVRITPMVRCSTQPTTDATTAPPSTASPAPAKADPKALTPGTDVTFLVASDLHLGADGTFNENKTMVRDMNTMAGRRWPGALGGAVGKPRGLLVSGDITDAGTKPQWDMFTSLYGLNGTDAPLKMPVCECTGNHDRGWDVLRPEGQQFIAQQVTNRHGSLARSWDWDSVHMVCCDVYPSAEIVAWLKQDLAVVGTQRPVVIYFHYGLSGPYSDWWSSAEKDAFYQVIKSFNVVALIHGHYHVSRQYKWKGLSVYEVGSPKHAWKRFLAVNITDTQLKVAAWNYVAGHWDWCDVKAIR